MNNSWLLVTIKRKALVKKLSAMFLDDAEKLKGLYNGIERIAVGNGKKNFKPLFELYQRIQYMPKYSEITEMTKPVFEAKERDPRILLAFGRIVFTAVGRAGINHDPSNAIITLDHKSVKNYSDWNGDQIYPDDTVKIISPAWFQNGCLIEEGFCIKDYLSGTQDISNPAKIKVYNKT